MKKFIHVLIAALLFNCTVFAQSSGDYRSIENGNWNDPTKWEMYNGTNWSSTTTYPGENPGTGSVTIMNETKIAITASVPHPVSSIDVISGGYVCYCAGDPDEYNAVAMLNGVLTFSAQNAVSLVVSGSVAVWGELGINDENGTKTHSLFIGGSFGVGDGWYDYETYYTPTVFQTINQDDKLHVIFNTTVPNSSIWNGGFVGFSFQDITFNGIGISFQSGDLVKGHANFINGIVSGYSLNFGDDAIVSGASAASYVEGSVTKQGDDAFTFPIGSGGVYAPLTISAPSDPGAIISASYTRSDASNIGPISDPALVNISNCEYWVLNSNTSNLNVTVYWSSSSGCESTPYVTNVSEVTLAYFDNATQKWNSHGGSGIGTSANGSVTWNGVNSYGYFTLGNLNACNAPWGATATNITSNSATLSWDAISGAISYDVDYLQAFSNLWINAAKATTSTSVNLSGLSSSSTYYWRVKTNCSSSSSPYRSSSFYSLCGSASSLSTSIITNNSAMLSWSPVLNASSYNVHYKQSGTTTWVTIATGITSLSYSLGGLSAPISYDWRVAANCSAGGQGNYAQTSFITASQPCSDVYESNNTSNQAKSIALGTTISASISSSADIDWFKITTPNSAYNLLGFTLSNLAADYDLYLYDKRLMLVGTSTNTGTSNEGFMYNANQRKATYYIKVISKNGAYNSWACYNLLAQVSNGPNSAFSKSYPVNEVTDISEKQWLYPNPASEFVYLNFNSASEGPVNVQIVNSIGQLVKQHPVNTIKGHNQFKIRVNDIRPGIYILRINKGNLNITRKFVIAR